MLPSSSARPVWRLVVLSVVLGACDQTVPEGETPIAGPRDDVYEEGCEEAEAVAVRPTGTYLRTSRDAPAAPTVLRLADLGVVPGDELRLERLGEFQYEGQDDVTLVRYRLLAVFSASDAVRPTAERERVEGALDAGSDYVSMASHNDDLDTDIPEDFLVAGDGATTQVRVPERAAFLLFSPDDDYFADNLDEDADYRVCVTRLP